MKQFIVSIFILVFSSQLSYAQQTVGLFLNDSDAFNGYTLFSPDYYTETYLMDNCGKVVNSWTSNYTTGLATYLLENGDLLRTARTNASTFGAGGTGGRIERFDWNGNLIWEYEYSNADFHQHHDIEYMPNGNILILAWEKININDVIASGRNPNTIPAEFWCEKIVEITPIGSDSAALVWEWRAWDHLIQDFDSTKANYGIVADHPELLDLNFVIPGAPGPGNGLTDWLHCNSIDYNEDFDQIMISCHNFSELWVIDHSTTTLEASGSSGGTYGKGGNILYRWGNPQAYDKGTVLDQILFLQHDAIWIEQGLPDEGKVMIFNNGLGRPAGAFSSVEVIECPVNAQGFYTDPGNSAYAPAQSFWTYTATIPTDFYSPNISSAQRLPNGNTLICEGASGHLFEIDLNGNIHWDYINPVSTTGPVAQGGIPVINNVFKTTRYAPDFPAFIGKILTPGAPVELNPAPSNCTIYTSINEHSNNNLVSLNSLVTDNIRIDNRSGKAVTISVLNLQGSLLTTKICEGIYCNFDAQHLTTGIYFINIKSNDLSIHLKTKIIKL